MIDDRRQSVTGLVLALLILVAWVASHVTGVFFYPLSPSGLLMSPPLLVVITWLNVGLFIIAHDCMHGSLTPRWPRINASVGRVALGLYAAFSFDRLRPKHFEHHREPGTKQDPDFSPDYPRHFWRWYMAFFRAYFGWRELMVLTGLVAIYVFVLDAPILNLLLFWALPAILSSLQLFYFGTFLPHRAADQRFDDKHNARSNDYGWLMSLLTCFHFGYHLEHHRSPGTPWWRLPVERLRSGSSR